MRLWHWQMTLFSSSLLSLIRYSINPFLHITVLTSSVVYVKSGMVCMAYETLVVSDLYSGVQHLEFWSWRIASTGIWALHFLRSFAALFYAVDGSGSQYRRISTVLVYIAQVTSS